ncbi:MAG: hypothetical protein KA354_22595 [Phycisphaerae bacterium]|nr:hypothetical protein [Phycisphaerae bacterium]
MCSLALAAAVILAVPGRQPSPRLVVETEEVVTSYVPANNGAGPSWCYGSTIVARQDDVVFASMIETGKDVPPLCNTRWQLWRRDAAGWKLVQHEGFYRQREPCPIGVFRGGPVFLSVNPSTEPPGTQYGACHPLVLQFDVRKPGAKPVELEPVWAVGTHFTDHSYRGFAADGESGELLLLNINARSGEQFVSHRDRKGAWHARGTIRFPIRSCYPQVALRGGAAHVLAIGDIVEPNEEWRRLKLEKTGSKWDYVFRRLFYAFTPDLSAEPFSEPIEVDSVEKTAGHMTNLDLHVDSVGAAHLLYLKRPHQYAFLRDKYFPGQPMVNLLEYVIIRDGKVALRRTLAGAHSDGGGADPLYARFHVVSDQRLGVIVAGTGTGVGGRPVFANWWGPIGSGDGAVELVQVEMRAPMRSYFTATPRGGSRPSRILDLFGTADDSLQFRYARVVVGDEGR